MASTPSNPSLSQGHDLNLMRLKEPIEFTDKIRPVCLPTAAANEGEEATIVGYGEGFKGTGELSWVSEEGSIIDLVRISY